MANICTFYGKVHGSPKSVSRLAQMLRHDSHEYFKIGRGVYEVDSSPGEDAEHSYLSGSCPWAVDSSLMREKSPDVFSPGLISLSTASHILNISIELFSEEPGCCFAEHILIKDGNVCINDEADYHEYSLDEYETIEECESELEIDVTAEEWFEGYASRGGFEQEFCI